MNSIVISDFINSLVIFVESGLFFDEIKHGLVTMPFVLLVYYKTKSTKLSFVTLLTTYLIDSDHLVDYLMYYGFDFSFTRFLSFEYFMNTKRAIVPLHGWEWALFLVLLGWERSRWKSYLTAIGIGVFSHLIWDSITVGSVLFYSFTYRALHEFILFI